MNDRRFRFDGVCEHVEAGVIDCTVGQGTALYQERQLTIGILNASLQNFQAIKNLGAQRRTDGCTTEVYLIVLEQRSCRSRG